MLLCVSQSVSVVLRSRSPVRSWSMASFHFRTCLMTFSLSSRLPRFPFKPRRLVFPLSRLRFWSPSPSRIPYGVSGIESLRSRSIQGLSVITVVFRSGTDVYRDRQAVTERLSTVASGLPTGVQPPLMTPLTSSTTWVMEVGLASDKQSPMTLRTIADWTVKPRLLAVGGVAGIEAVGGEVRQIQFQFDPQRLRQYGGSGEEVIAPAPRRTGGSRSGFCATP